MHDLFHWRSASTSVTSADRDREHGAGEPDDPVEALLGFGVEDLERVQRLEAV